MNAHNKIASIGFLSLLLCVNSGAHAMKSQKLETKPPLANTSGPLCFSNDSETDYLDEIRRAQHREMPPAGSRIYGRELLVFSTSEGEELEVISESESAGGYLSDKAAELAKQLGRKGYEKMVDASDFVDTRFVAGLATAATLSALVWLGTSSAKNSPQVPQIADITIEKSAGGMLSASELKKQLDAEAARAEQLARALLEKEEKLKTVDEQLAQVGLQLEESKRVAKHAEQNNDLAELRDQADMRISEQESENSLLKEKIRLLETFLAAERSEKEEMKAKLKMLEEDLSGAAQINSMLLAQLPDPEAFIESIKIKDDN